MKYTNIILTLIALLLVLVLFRIDNINKALARLSEDNVRISDSNAAVVNSSQRLENSILELRKQVADTGERLIPGGRQPKE